MATHRWLRVGRNALAGSAGLGALVFAGALAEAHAFALRTVRMPVLAEGSSPVRILHISDIHLMPGQDDKLAFLSGLAELRPDLVVSTGDHLSSPAATDELFRSVEPLLRLPGVFVFGSNDFEAPHFRVPALYLWKNSPPHEYDPAREMPWRELRDRLAAYGWRDLDDNATRLVVGDHTIDLRGTGDPHVHRDHYDHVAGPVSPQAEITIGVTHAPYRRVLDAMADDGVAVILAGHTHGGQVCLPGGRAIVTNSDTGPDHARGLSHWSHEGHETLLHVSAGLGSSPYAPYRLFCRPEATLLTLTAKGS